MKDKNVEINDLSLLFSIEEAEWKLRMAKSQTRVGDSRQIRLLSSAPAESFVPLEVEVEQDAFTFSFFVDSKKKQWDELKKLHLHEKLRLLCNLSPLKKYIQSRITFFLHPDNVVFDDSLRPYIIYRGLRHAVPPFEMNEDEFLKQLKCYSVALISEKFTFEDLYNGEMIHATETNFEKTIQSKENLDQLIDYLEKSYAKEQEKVEKTKALLPTKRFRLFKRLSISFIIVSILLAVPLTYLAFVIFPEQETLLEAQEEFLASDYDGVISELRDEEAEELPQASKYILSYSYVLAEPLSEQEKNVIMNNISLNGNENYLLYWIYNGRGEFSQAMDEAKYIDDPRLIIYGLIKQIEQAKNNPDLSGSERDEKVSELQQELEEYREEYDLNDEESQFENETNEANENASESETENSEDSE